MIPLALGYDPGVGNDKLAAFIASGMTTAVIPAIVGVGETDLGQLNMGDLGRSRRRNLPAVVSFGTPPISYLVGENVERYALPVQRTDFALYDGPERRALFYASAHQVLGAGDHTVSILAGLPVQIVGDRATARDALRALRAWIVGEHVFEIDGDRVRLTVTHANVMAQPAGTFFAWGLDNEGIWTRDPGDLRVPVAICDIGFNTLDLFTVEGGEVIGATTGGDTSGMRRAAELIAGRAQAQYGVKISLAHADQMTRERDPVLHTPEGTVNVFSLVQQGIDTAAANAITFLDQKWGNARQFRHVLFTGGGAETLKPYLLRKIPHGVVMPDAVAANAIGLARYGWRMNKMTAGER